MGGLQSLGIHYQGEGSILGLLLWGIDTYKSQAVSIQCLVVTLHQ